MGRILRLDKFLADAGAGTRSEVKRLIQKGMVQIDGEIVRRPEQKVDPECCVTLDGRVINAAPEFVYYLLHKPAGCVSATEDKKEKTVMEYVPSGRKGLFPVGRLDKDTEGLLLITDDGALAHALLSPRKHIEKTYFVRTAGILSGEDVRIMAQGVDIGDEKCTLPAKLEVLQVFPDGISEALLTISEGRFHQVKRMMEAAGKKVLYLKRLSMGPLRLPDDLKAGCCRPLTSDEVECLRKIKEG